MIMLWRIFITTQIHSSMLKVLKNVLYCVYVHRAVRKGTIVNLNLSADAIHLLKYYVTISV